MSGRQDRRSADSLEASGSQTKSQRVDLQMSILADLQCGLQPDSVVLDLGCGNGDLVQQYRDRGFAAFGCDFQFKPGPHVDELCDQGAICVIDDGIYRLPFDDATFDVVFSDQVFEHAQNFSETLAEMKRVMKPGGVSLHIFPSRYRPLEVHVGVPLASVIQSSTWLYLWAMLGVRNKHQKDLSAEQTAKNNFVYLTGHTNYLTKRELTRHLADANFGEFSFCEALFLKNTRKGRSLYALSRILPFIPSLFSACYNRVLFTRKSFSDRQRCS